MKLRCYRQFKRLLLWSPCLTKKSSYSHCTEAMESLSLELPNGEIAVGYDKDITALQGWASISFLRFFFPEMCFLRIFVMVSFFENLMEFSVSTILSEEISSLRSRQRHLDQRRREALDKLIDLKGTVFDPDNCMDCPYNFLDLILVKIQEASGCSAVCAHWSQQATWRENHRSL